jgi:hypothetical protein
MGRELKRVPLDFKWPIGQIWKGFLNPYSSQKCRSCDGSGLNEATKKISDDWYSFDKAKWIDLGDGRRYNDLAWSNHITEIEIAALLEHKRLMDFTRVPLNDKQRKDVEEKISKGENSWLPYNNGKIPTPEEVNEWNHKGFGHDGINQWICVEARAKHLGVYGNCEYCDGEGVIWQSEEIKKLSDEWESFEPPAGEGFQLWSTTSEGNPMSPVFDSLENLCEYLEKEKVSVFGSDTQSKEKWMEMLSEDFVTYKKGNAIII